ncbi:MAG: type II secretion system F family protein [Acidimicrobiales bacterium]
MVSFRGVQGCSPGECFAGRCRPRRRGAPRPRARARGQGGSGWWTPQHRASLGVAIRFDHVVARGALRRRSRLRRPGHRPHSDGPGPPAHDRERAARHPRPTDHLRRIRARLRLGNGSHRPFRERAPRPGDHPVATGAPVGVPRRDALGNMLARTDVPELRQFVNAIIQADSYGVPISRVLRAQAGEQREKRRFRAEERAIKLPVKVIFPLVFCILPVVFLVVLGPAYIRFTSGLG